MIADHSTAPAMASMTIGINASQDWDCSGRFIENYEGLTAHELCAPVLQRRSEDQSSCGGVESSRTDAIADMAMRPTQRRNAGRVGQPVRLTHTRPDRAGLASGPHDFVKRGGAPTHYASAADCTEHWGNARRVSVRGGVRSCPQYRRDRLARQLKSTEMGFGLPKKPSATPSPTLHGCFIRRRTQRRRSRSSSTAQFAMSNFTCRESRNGPAMPWHSSSLKSVAGMPCGTSGSFRDRSAA